MTTRGAKPSRRQQPTRSVREELLIAKGQLRAITRLVTRMNAGQLTPDGASRFVALAVQNRGGFGVLCALDASGLIWERHTVYDSATKSISDEWWEPIGMERRTKGGRA